MRNFALVAVLVFLCTPAMAVTYSQITYTSSGANVDYDMSYETPSVWTMHLSAQSGGDPANFTYTDQNSVKAQSSAVLQNPSMFHGTFDVSQTDYSVTSSDFGYVCDGGAPGSFFPNQIIGGMFQSSSVRYDNSQHAIIITGTLSADPGSSIVLANAFIGGENGENTIGMPDWQDFPRGTMTMKIHTDAYSDTNPDAEFPITTLDQFFALDSPYNLPTDITIQATAVPEPLTLTATLIGLGVLGHKVRRRVVK